MAAGDFLATPAMKGKTVAVIVASGSVGKLAPAGLEVVEIAVGPQMEAVHLDLAVLSGPQGSALGLVRRGWDRRQLRGHLRLGKGAGGGGVGGETAHPHHEAVGAAVGGGRWCGAPPP
jgi:hypothetical protein